MSLTSVQYLYFAIYNFNVAYRDLLMGSPMSYGIFAHGNLFGQNEQANERSKLVFGKSTCATGQHLILAKKSVYIKA